ncbi:unnamed protein product [Urochloa humidicola]
MTLKQLLEELTKKMDESKSNFDDLRKKMDESKLKADETNRKIEGMQLSIDTLVRKQGSIQAWKPQLEGKVTKLQNAMTDLKLKVDLFIHDLPKKLEEGGTSVETSAPAHLGATAKAEASGLHSHHEEIIHRRVGAGVVTILVPPPVKGATHESDLYPTPVYCYDRLNLHPLLYLS